jgi:regulator of ribonuclease activity A
MAAKTADLYDQHPSEVKVAEPLFRDYGGVPVFQGQIVTLKIHEDNSLVRQALEQAGAGKVLVVDGGGSVRCALVGDQLAVLAYKNGWAGLVVFGAIRDAAEIGEIEIGLKALNTNPTKSLKRGEGQRDIPVTFAGVTFTPGHYLYADRDGLLVAEQELA